MLSLQNRQYRYSVRQLMTQTAIASLFFASLFTENEWCRATLGTLTIAVIFNEFLAVIFAREDRRAFAIGHSLASVLFPFSLYAAAFTLPYLITVKLMEWIDAYQKLDETNFVVVMYIFWLNAMCRLSGYTALYWYRLPKREETYRAEALV